MNRPAGQKNRKSRTKPKPTTPETIDTQSQPIPPPATPVVPLEEKKQPEHVRIFERLFRAFRQQVFEHCGRRYEEMLAKSENKIRLLSPGFDAHALNADTALFVCDLIGEIVGSAPLFKRAKLRKGALTLLADIYTKHYDLLEQQEAIDRLEQVYYRLHR